MVDAVRNFVADIARDKMAGAAQEAATVPCLRIFCFTWNTESVRIGETLHRSGHESSSVVADQWFGCLRPDMLPDLLRYALPHEHDAQQPPYDLLVFALQEAAKPGSYFLSHALPHELGSRYVLIGRSRMVGVGKTTMRSLRDEWTLKTRGLRLHVYVRAALEPHVRLIGDMYEPCGGRDLITHGKGGVGIGVHVRDHGVVGFLNVHLPFDAATLYLNNRDRVRAGVRVQNAALNALVSAFDARFHPHYLFVMGDLNYRVLHVQDVKAAAALAQRMAQGADERRRVYQQCDELRKSIDIGALPPLREGVDPDTGPASFMPTAKLVHGRVAGATSVADYKVGKAQQRNPSWCDRILYATRPELHQTGPPLRTAADRGRTIEGDGFVTCTHYERFDVGTTMPHSDHAAVWGAYTLEANLGLTLRDGGVEVPPDRAPTPPPLPELPC